MKQFNVISHSGGHMSLSNVYPSSPLLLQLQLSVYLTQNTRTFCLNPSAKGLGERHKDFFRKEKKKKRERERRGGRRSVVIIIINTITIRREAYICPRESHASE